MLQGKCPGQGWLGARRTDRIPRAEKWGEATGGNPSKYPQGGTARTAWRLSTTILSGQEPLGDGGGSQLRSLV